MRARRALPFVAACLALLAAAAPACTSGGDKPAPPTSVPTTVPAAYSPRVLLGRVEGAVLAESSGLVASKRNPGLIWTHNDSGGGPVIYCLTRKAARCGDWAVTGAESVDWEDIAAGPGPGGGAYLYIGDIGDNAGQRQSVAVYRVAEPQVNEAALPAAGTPPQPTEPAQALRLAYPDGPRNAEALMVHPTSGDLYIVTKDQPPRVYKAPAPLEPAAAGTITLAPVGNLELGGLRTPVDVVTGGDISPDGQWAAVCTYVDVYEFRLPEGSTEFDRIWTQKPAHVEFGLRSQGESLAYRLDGRALLATAEDPDTPLFQVERS